MKTTAEKYRIGVLNIGATAKGKAAGTVTDANGTTTITIVISAAVDSGGRTPRVILLLAAILFTA